MKSTISFVLTFVLFLILSACALVREGNIIAVTQVYDGPNEANLAIGEMLVVQIPTIPQEGFEWVLQGYDTAILDLKGDGDCV